MPRIGHSTCLRCNTQEIEVNRSATGKLHSRCHRCGSYEWPTVGSKSHRDLLAVTVLDDDAPPAGAAAAPDPAPQPAKVQPKTANSVFSLADL